MSSLYTQYIKEREGKEVLETDYGFVIYEVDGSNLFIQDLFITKDRRKEKLATNLVDQVVEEGRSKGCKDLYSVIDFRSLNWNDALNFALKYGMNFHKEELHIMYLKKAI